ncbi:MAG: dihydrofolate reductase family protein [Chloroflexi bacterium]|nr:dihydrofolate reductase family protein [Chloroflexota bacterium]
MSRLIVYNRISLDGYFAGPNGEIDWFVHDPEVDAVAHEVYKADALLFGRVTYQLFEAFWSHIAEDESADPTWRATSRELNNLPKLVASRSLSETTWINSSLLAGDLIEEARRLKAENDGTLAIFGSGSIVKQLAAADLIDEYLIIVTPFICGSGLKMFEGDIGARLRLLKCWDFASGNVLLHYASAAR